jgi:hypothetical protein
MRALGVPFCRVCRQAIWNRISPLATLPARDRTAINVVARFPEHLDVLAVASDGRTMSNWWDQASGWAGWFPIGNLQCRPGSTVNVVCRYSDHIDLFTTASDGRTMSTWWDVRTGWGTWFHVSGGIASPSSPVTAITRYSHHLDLINPLISYNAENIREGSMLEH